VVQQGGNNGAVESHAGPLSIYNSILERSAIGLRNYASPIYLENSQIRNNSDFGILDGATDVTAELKIVNSTVANNGGIGIYKRNGDLQMDNSSVVGNHDNGLEIRYSKANIRNSTISGNRSKHAKYGEAGVFVKGSQVELYFVSVVRNVGGGLEIDAESLVNLYGTIVADNREDKYPDCDGKINSQGFNLVENLSGCTITGVTTGNILGLDPRLGALYRNGGSTPNHLPVRNSPVVDAITTEACQGRISDERFTDQRYQARPRDGDGNGVMGCDIGAVERQSATERSRR
jgi:hypothetical protein